MVGSGPYHPVGITAPSNATDAFSAKYYSVNQTFSDSLQTDSLESISTCEYWDLRRLAGSSTVKPTLYWNSNSCNVSSYDNLRVTYLDTTTTPDRWKSLGNAGVAVTGARGSIAGSLAFTPAYGHLTIGKFKFPTVYAVLKRELDGGYYNVVNGKLCFKFDEEYNDLDNVLAFNIYNNLHQVVASGSTVASPLAVNIGDNRYMLNVLACNVSPYGSLPAGYYVLEVINEKNEKSYLRFKNIVTISVSCTGTIPLPE